MSISNAFHLTVVQIRQTVHLQEPDNTLSQGENFTSDCLKENGKKKTASFWAWNLKLIATRMVDDTAVNLKAVRLWYRFSTGSEQSSVPPHYTASNFIHVRRGDLSRSRDHEARKPLDLWLPFCPVRIRNVRAVSFMAVPARTGNGFWCAGDFNSPPKNHAVTSKGV